MRWCIVADVAKQGLSDESLEDEIPGIELPPTIASDPTKFEVALISYSLRFRAASNEYPITVVTNLIDSRTLTQQGSWHPVIANLVNSQNKGWLCREITNPIYFDLINSGPMLLQIDPYIPDKGFLVFDFRLKQ